MDVSDSSLTRWRRQGSIGPGAPTARRVSPGSSARPWTPWKTRTARSNGRAGKTACSTARSTWTGWATSTAPSGCARSCSSSITASMVDWLAERRLDRPLKIWRIAKARHADTHWDGIGTRFVASRWISRAGERHPYRRVPGAGPARDPGPLPPPARHPRDRLGLCQRDDPSNINLLRLITNKLPEVWTTGRTRVLREEDRPA